MSDLAEPIKDLKLQIDKKPINFNELLPTDIHSDIYDITKMKNFSELEQQFANIHRQLLSPTMLLPLEKISYLDISYIVNMLNI